MLLSFILRACNYLACSRAPKTRITVGKCSVCSCLAHTRCSRHWVLLTFYSVCSCLFSSRAFSVLGNLELYSGYSQSFTRSWHWMLFSFVWCEAGQLTYALTTECCYALSWVQLVSSRAFSWHCVRLMSLVLRETALVSSITRALGTECRRALICVQPFSSRALSALSAVEFCLRVAVRSLFPPLSSFACCTFQL